VTYQCENSKFLFPQDKDIEELIMIVQSPGIIEQEFTLAEVFKGKAFVSGSLKKLANEKIK